MDQFKTPVTASVWAIDPAGKIITSLSEENARDWADAPRNNCIYFFAELSAQEGDA